MPWYKVTKTVTYLSEHGFADFDELDAATEKYFQLKEDHAAAKARVARLKKERAEARRDDAAMPSPPIRTSKNIQDFAAPPRTTKLYAGEFVIILGKKRYQAQTQARQAEENPRAPARHPDQARSREDEPISVQPPHDRKQQAVRARD